MSNKKLEKAFLTGCDSKTEWQLPFFIKKYKEFEHKTPLIVCDFGMTEKTMEKVNKHPDIDVVMSYPKKDMVEKGWFLKPMTMFNAPANQLCWFDTDCVFHANVDDIFDHFEENKLNMVEDKPWSKRRGEVWHNSGVVGMIGKPHILYHWVDAVRKNPHIGDQEVLHSILNPITRLQHINTILNRYNVLRLQVEHDNYKGKIHVMHWTGQKGNEKLKELINA